MTVALDDFEPGVFRSIEGAPIDIIKLDLPNADALGGESSRSLLKGIVSWAHQLGLTVAARNIEAESDLTLAVEVGFDHLHGLLISPPLQTSAVSDFITR